MSWGGAFDSLFCPEGRVFVHNDCPRGGGRVFDPFKSCPAGWFWMKLIPTLYQNNIKMQKLHILNKMFEKQKRRCILRFCR